MAKSGRKAKTTPEEDAMAAASRATRVGWYIGSVTGGQFVVAINPNDSSEIWMFYNAENIWKRKGEEACVDLRCISGGGKPTVKGKRKS